MSTTIDDIRFDDYIYGNARNWTLLLYQLNGISAVIPLSNANLMSFIRVLDDSIECQNLIDQNPQKSITLFAYDENICPWLTNNIHIPNNLRSIKIFCHSDDQLCISAWTRRYMQRFNNTIFDVITFEDLNYNLLSFGLKHIKKLHQEYEDDFGIRNLLDRDYQQICLSLGNDALRRADIENERIRQSREAQN